MSFGRVFLSPPEMQCGDPYEKGLEERKYSTYVIFAPTLKGLSSKN
jgi:hypothetical protein